MNYNQRLLSKINFIDFSHSFDFDSLFEPFWTTFKKPWFHPVMAVVALIHNTSTFFLAQFVYASGTLVIAVYGDPDAAIPW